MMVEASRPRAVSGGVLHLTFDDGPDPRWTPQVLDVLADAGALATFFVLGAGVCEHPEIVDAVRTAGHRVELHGFAHLDHRYSTHDELARDTAAAEQTLRSVAIQPTWWRLPWGRPGPATGAVAAAHDLRLVGWDVDTHDWRGDGPSEQTPAFWHIAKRGGVILLHDGRGPGAHRGDVTNTLDLVRAAVTCADASGTPVTALPGPRLREAAHVPAGIPSQGQHDGAAGATAQAGAHR